MSKSRTLLSILVASAASLSLLACSQSPEQIKAKKEEQLRKFCTEVSKHILDRDPSTIQVSVNELIHGELSDQARTSLQAQKVIPDTAIDVLKLISDSEVSKQVNVVEVTAVKPVSSLDKDDVQVLVTGKEVIKEQGKVVGTQPFSMTMTCRISPEAEGFTQLIDLKGFPANRKMSMPVEASGRSKKNRKRG
ncbi:MAG: hypothetical protein K2Y32_16615 [Candidatus Obscuribacterales bacterium]|nr:hypothetical protein [Candidatus Obscuribacterales bacterium]